jgi:hypothetical protein
MVKRQPNRNKKNDIGNCDPGEHGNPRDWQRGWQPKIVQLVKPFFDPPDIRVSGKIH